MEELLKRVVDDYGGNWNRGVNAGARAVNTNNRPWNVNTNNGSRLACDTLKRCLIPGFYNYGYKSRGILEKEASDWPSPPQGESKFLAHLRVRQCFIRRPDVN